MNYICFLGVSVLEGIFSPSFNPEVGMSELYLIFNSCLFPGGQKISCDLCEQALEQVEPGSDGFGHSVLGRGLPLSPHWAARGILCSPL